MIGIGAEADVLVQCKAGMDSTTATALLKSIVINTVAKLPTLAHPIIVAVISGMNTQGSPSEMLAKVLMPKVKDEDRGSNGDKTEANLHESKEAESQST